MQLISWKYWVALVLALGLFSGLQSYRIALLKNEALESQISAAKEGAKASKDREEIEHENRKLPITNIDRKLRASGWMRD